MAGMGWIAVFQQRELGIHGVFGRLGKGVEGTGKEPSKLPMPAPGPAPARGIHGRLGPGYTAFVSLEFCGSGRTGLQEESPQMG